MDADNLRSVLTNTYGKKTKNYYKEEKKCYINNEMNVNNLFNTKFTNIISEISSYMTNSSAVLH